MTTIDQATADLSRLRYETAPARRERILELIRQFGFGSAGELAAILSVSEMTVRRDFRRLADQGLVRQVHGGVSALTTVAGPIDFRLRATQHQEAKRAIASRAIGLLQPGSVVGLDAGTTTLEVARQLGDDLRLTVVTHSLPAMGALTARPSIEVIGLGGHLHAETQAFAGTMTVQAIAEIRMNTLLLAMTAIRAGDMWCTNTFDADTKRALISAADRVVLLADSSKFGATAVMRVAPLDGIQTLITDDGLDPDTRRELEQSGIEVVIVEDRSERA